MAIEAVVLAAGYSSRAEAFKMELTVGGRTVIQRCIAGMYDLCARIIVVGGYRIERLEAVLQDYAKVELVCNPRYAEGMFTSVKEGARHVRGERFFFTPGDYPLISPAVCRSLLAAEGEIVIPVHGGRKGHPVLLAGELAAELVREDDSSNLRDFIQRKGYQTLEVAEPGILLDLDTQADYRRILERFGEGGEANEP